MAVQDRRRRVSGWGFEDAGLSATQATDLEALLASVFPDAELERREPRPLDDVTLPDPRLDPPDALEAICHTDARTRCLHAWGRSFTDLVHAFRGEFPNPPDVVATPRTEDEVAAVLDWCASSAAACIPFGGGTSVVGGVNPPEGEQAVVTLQLRAMNRVLEVDDVSRAARIEAGACGPVIEAQFAGSANTLHYLPQSWELSTLGGWLATHSAGHFGMHEVHVDDLVEQITAVTPQGRWESRRLPYDGAGPDPDRMLLGSEGILGVITSAWMRLTPRPQHRAGLRVEFDGFEDGVEAVRMLAQSRLDAQHMRLLPAFEAAIGDVGDGSCAVLLLGFESAHASIDEIAALALEACRDAGGVAPDGIDLRSGSDIGGEGDLWEEWRESYLSAAYQRDVLVSLGVIVETFETAIPWRDLPDLRRTVLDATQKAVDEVCGGGLVSCRVSHAYADGATPYFTVVAPGRRGSEVEQWREVKAAAADAILGAGGTITHHHAVGRDHRPWYDRQTPEPFRRALAAAKSAVDPAVLLNPGVLVDVP